MIVFWSTFNIVCVVWFIFSFSYCSLVMQLVGLLIFFFLNLSLTKFSLANWSSERMNPVISLGSEWIVECC